MISVIVPAYNAEKYIGKCLRSILRQSFKDIELIVVNDCSTDKTLSECNKMLTGGVRSIVIDKQKNEGVDKARYDGVQAAHGEWTAFVDADDWLPVDALRLLHEAATSHAADVAMGGMRRCALGGCVSWTFQIFPSEWANSLRRGSYLARAIFAPQNHANGLLTAHLFRTETLKRRYAPTGLTIGEDQIQILRIIAATDTIYCIPDVVYYYRYNSGVTFRFKENHMELSRQLYRAKEREAKAIGVYSQVAADLKRSYIDSLEDYVARFINGRPITEGAFLRIITEELHNDIYKELADVDYHDRTVADCIARKDAEGLYRHIERKQHDLPLKGKMINLVRRIF